MLVLRRKLGESIIIGGNIEIMVTDIGKIDEYVKLGINAPREISVHRKEVQEAINREKELSAAGIMS